MDAKQEYIEIINEFINKTEAGKIKWKRQNSTTIYVETLSESQEKVLISLQKVQDRVLKRDRQRAYYKQTTSFLFTVKNASNNELIMQIDSTNQEEYEKYLDELFKIANYRIEKKNIDFLRGIMDNL